MRPVEVYLKGLNHNSVDPTEDNESYYFDLYGWYSGGKRAKPGKV